jgi:hypothetical protein
MESEIDSLKKTCLLYYFLKDFRTGLDGKYASEQAIPEQFCELISGFYAMDHLQFEVCIGRWKLNVGSGTPLLLSERVSRVYGSHSQCIPSTFRVSKCTTTGGSIR